MPGAASSPTTSPTRCGFHPSAGGPLREDRNPPLPDVRRLAHSVALGGTEITGEVPPRPPGGGGSPRSQACLPLGAPKPLRARGVAPNDRDRRMDVETDTAP